MTEQEVSRQESREKSRIRDAGEKLIMAIAKRSPEAALFLLAIPVHQYSYEGLSGDPNAEETALYFVATAFIAGFAKGLINRSREKGKNFNTHDLLFDSRNFWSGARWMLISLLGLSAAALKLHEISPNDVAEFTKTAVAYLKSQGSNESVQHITEGVRTVTGSTTKEPISTNSGGGLSLPDINVSIDIRGIIDTIYSFVKNQIATPVAENTSATDVIAAGVAGGLGAATWHDIRSDSEDSIRNMVPRVVKTIPGSRFPVTVGLPDRQVGKIQDALRIEEGGIKSTGELDNIIEQLERQLKKMN